jgi:hypothetical protein
MASDLKQPSHFTAEGYTEATLNALPKKSSATLAPKANQGKTTWDILLLLACNPTLYFSNQQISDVLVGVPAGSIRGRIKQLCDCGYVQALIWPDTDLIVYRISPYVADVVKASPV